VGLIDQCERHQVSASQSTLDRGRVIGYGLSPVLFGWPVANSCHGVVVWFTAPSRSRGNAVVTRRWRPPGSLGLALSGAF